jgi:hypothetical protein
LFLQAAAAKQAVILMDALLTVRFHVQRILPG